MNTKKVFISYSWDSEQHKAWVRKIADGLEEHSELHVTWDGYDLDSLADKNYFMESGVHDADFVVVIATKTYREKADSRKGGVGIETFLATAAHWTGMLKNKASKLIVIKREEDSVPRYLEGHIYLDFTEDGLFSQQFGELLNMIRGNAKIPRPKKRKTLSAKEFAYEFTKVEELIRVNHPNRRAIVNSIDGTDFSAGNRIKYELWETRSPALGYFIALHDNINITQTANHAVTKLLEAGLRPSGITVLRHRSARPEQELISSAFEARKFSTQVYECTYKEYIWDYCIDETLKAIDPPNTIENYTNQSLAVFDPDSPEPTRVDSALDHIVDKLLKPSHLSAHLVVAPGGMGKTSLCLSVAKRLYFRNDLRSSVILIQAESIKRYIADKGIVPSRIESIYDIYELYAKYQAHGKIFERSTFDLAVVCGNLTIIIDGLDELSSLFQDQFDVGAFLESLKQLHDQLGSSNILLTTRNNVVAADAGLNELAIAKYELLGFDTDSCKRYVTKRLQGYTDESDLVKKVMSQIAKVRLHDHEGRIVPFLADIATTVIEDEIKDGTRREFEVSDDQTPYPSNNELTDHIVYSILRREVTRHKLEITVAEVVEIITGLVADFGKRWAIDELRVRLQILYEARAQSVFSKLLLNPLFLVRNGEVELRYSFLGSYFEVLFMLQGILRSSLESERVRSLARLSMDSEEARELRRYITNHIEEVGAALRSLIPKLRDRAVSNDINKVSLQEREYAKEAIAAVLQLYCGVQSGSIDLVTATVMEIFGLSASTSHNQIINGLFIKGDFPTLDFTGLTLSNSRFQAYRNLLSSRFLRTKFIYSTFVDCGAGFTGTTSLEPGMIDSTCDAGDLREVFVLSKVNKGDEQVLIQSEATRFLHSFFRGDRFIDNKPAHIKFSTKVRGLATDKFDRLISEGFVVLCKEKTVAKFYEITTSFKPSVRKFLVDGYPDSRMKKFFAFVR